MERQASDFQGRLVAVLTCSRWQGSKIVRFNKEGTQVIFEILFPKVYSVTACCFGGPEGDQLFVTTAKPSAANIADSDSVLEQYPDSGHLFRVDFEGRFRGGVWRHAFAG
jgi:sugar lactone lactonase YvrE